MFFRKHKIVFLFLVFFVLSSLVYCLQARLKRGRTNILVLGVPGGSHPGPNLADTIMVLSIDPVRRDLVIISVPRDIRVSSFQTKINTLYALGGLDLFKKEIRRILGLNVDFGVVVDFEGFKKAIDLVDGLDVEVEHSFDDFHYPISGKENDDCGGDPEYKCRYEHLRFEKGVNHMDGELALKFARSRFATNSGEGTDFARSKRQQKIILAFKKRIFTKEVLLSPRALLGFLKIWRENIETDFGAKDFFKLLTIFPSVDWQRPRIFTLDWGEENQGGLLVNPPVEDYGSWVLLPRSGDWQEIQEKLQDFLEL